MTGFFAGGYWHPSYFAGGYWAQGDAGNLAASVGGSSTVSATLTAEGQSSTVSGRYAGGSSGRGYRFERSRPSSTPAALPTFVKVIETPAAKVTVRRVDDEEDDDDLDLGKSGLGPIHVDTTIGDMVAMLKSLPKMPTFEITVETTKETLEVNAEVEDEEEAIAIALALVY